MRGSRLELQRVYSKPHWGGPPRSRARLRLGCVLLWHPADVRGVPGLPCSAVWIVVLWLLTLQISGTLTSAQAASDSIACQHTSNQNMPNMTQCVRSHACSRNCICPGSAPCDSIPCYKVVNFNAPGTAAPAGVAACASGCRCCRAAGLPHLRSSWRPGTPSHQYCLRAPGRFSVSPCLPANMQTLHQWHTNVCSCGCLNL